MIGFCNVSAQKSSSWTSQGEDWIVDNSLRGNSRLQEMDSLVNASHYKKISSIVIAHKGKLVFEKYYNGSNDATLHNTRSATKTITGMLIGCLIDRGQLRSEQEFVAQFSKRKNIYNPDTRKDSITIEDLLTMSSILECNDWEMLSRGNEERMYLIEDWVKFYWDLPVKGYPEWKPRPEELPYERDFSYCTAGTVVLGDLINNITGSIEDYADQVLFHPLGISEKHWQITPLGFPMTGGGLGLKSKDLLKLGQLYLNAGNWNGKEVISKDWIQKSITPKAKMSEDYGGIEYGYLWWLTEFAEETSYYMTGSGGNKVAVFPDLEMVVVLTSTYFNGGRESHHQTDQLLTQYIVPALKDLND